MDINQMVKYHIFNPCKARGVKLNPPYAFRYVACLYALQLSPFSLNIPRTLFRIFLLKKNFDGTPRWPWGAFLKGPQTE